MLIKCECGDIFEFDTTGLPANLTIPCPKCGISVPLFHLVKDPVHVYYRWRKGIRRIECKRCHHQWVVNTCGATRFLGQCSKCHAIVAEDL
jgi:ribosomal protein S27E